MHQHLKILWNEYEYRKSRNSGYSLRAFARDMKLPPSTLSEILNGKKGFSVRAATAMSRRLKLRDQNLEIFLLSVRSCHARSRPEREIAEKKLQQFVTAYSRDIPKTDTVVSWVAEAVLRFSQQKGFRFSDSKIARVLGVDPYEVRFAWGFLTRLGFIENASPTIAFLAFQGAGKRLNVAYEQILDLAKKAFFAKKQKKISFTHELLFLRPQDVTAANGIIANCIEDLRRLEKRSASKAKLHYFTTQLFQLEKEYRT